MGFTNALQRYTCSLPFPKHPPGPCSSSSSSPPASPSCDTQHDALNHTPSEEDLIPAYSLQTRYAVAPFQYLDSDVYPPSSQIVCHSPLDKRYRKKKNRRSTMRSWERAASTLATSKSVSENAGEKAAPSSSSKSSKILFSSSGYAEVQVGKGG